MAQPVTIVDAGGLPVTNTSSLLAGTPMTPVDAGGMPVTLVDAGGYPVALINEDGTLWEGGVVTYDYYVDSNAGGGGDGSLATPFNTLAAVQSALSAGKSVALKRGSYWREQLNINFDNITIGVYGSGDMPVIDGADIVTTGWTQPDAITYPNVWSRSWSRTSATTTTSENLGYWQAGARTTRRTSLALLQAGSDGDWHTTDLTAQTSTVSIRASADPNTDGILREITKRHYAINSHSQILGVARTGLMLTGPVEMKRCVGHYNAFTGSGAAEARQLFLRDGNIHHTVTEGALTEDAIATEVDPDSTPVVFTAFRSVGTGFSHTFRRCLALFTGGNTRSNKSGFYAHGSSPVTISSLTMEGCISRGTTHVAAAASTLTVAGGYAEDVWRPAIELSTPVATVSHFMSRDSVTTNESGGTRIFRRNTTANTSTLAHCAGHIKSGNGFENTAGGTKPTLTNVSLFCEQSDAVTGGEAEITYSVIWSAARSLNSVTTLQTGDYNVFRAISGEVHPYFHRNGVLYTTLAAYQSASGQETNSVYCKTEDQVSGNGIAFWLGVANGENAGPPAGDWRINPVARVYNAAGATLSGVFADGVTPITLAGPQQHWDFNTRAVASGPPSRYPTLPATIAEMRTYLEDPEAWDFYP